VIGAITRYDYDAMIKDEDVSRRLAGLPPFNHMARCVLASLQSALVEDTVRRAAKVAALPGVRVMGPSPAPLGLLRGHYRWHMLLTAEKRAKLHQALNHLEQMKIPSQVRLKIDVDPYDML
jgi:primosomal protein N' (replication factor Y) (superfamily II helicase)